ncbi:hypothetical protein D3C80_1904980 [compost metagenome]
MACKKDAMSLPPACSGLRVVFSSSQKKTAAPIRISTAEVERTTLECRVRRLRFGKSTISDNTIKPIPPRKISSIEVMLTIGSSTYRVSPLNGP